MRSQELVIPGDLVVTLDDFQRRIEFAKQVGNAIHADVIDNRFVSGDGLPVDQWPVIDLEYVEAHLMVEKPLEYLEPVKSKGATRAIIHIESHFDLAELSAKARDLDILLGFAVNLDTDLAELKPVFAVSNYIQVMGIVPGRTGQRQDPQTTLAVSYLHKLPNRRLTISVDGGVTAQNIPQLKRLGANYFIASSAIYEHGDWAENFHSLTKAAENQTAGQPIS
jgi:ribulose-phosphate 3-epimerase